MKKYIVINLLLVILTTLLSSCSEEQLAKLNVNPIASDVVNPKNLIRGTFLANVSLQVAHAQRIAGMWSGQYRGRQRLYKSIYEYNISTEETETFFSYLYNGILLQNRKIWEGLPNDDLYQGISHIIEANAMGTATAIFGDLPYSEAIVEKAPHFDRQSDILEALQIRLDSAIAKLGRLSTSDQLATDNVYGSRTAAQWIQIAHTLKARYYLLIGEYEKANIAATNGISSNVASMYYIPLNANSGSSNILAEFLLDRSGDMRNDKTFLDSILTGTNPNTRANTKTNETARQKYYAITSSTAGKKGVSAPEAPMPIITYTENVLIRAEVETRINGVDAGLPFLNEVRTFLRSGDAFTKLDAADVLQYDDYVSADFDNGGIENSDNIDPKDALLREIFEERYVSLYGTFMPFLDANRLSKSDPTLALRIPFNTPTATRHPRRFLIPQNETNSNVNAPSQEGVSIFDPLPINQ